MQTRYAQTGMFLIPFQHSLFGSSPKRVNVKVRVKGQVKGVTKNGTTNENMELSRSSTRASSGLIFIGIGYVKEADSQLF